MLPLTGCRDILDNPDLSDAEGETTRDHLTTLAEVLIDSYAQKDPRSALAQVVLSSVPESMVEDIEERAAIREYDGEMDRDSAERVAVSDVLSKALVN